MDDVSAFRWLELGYSPSKAARLTPVLEAILREDRPAHHTPTELEAWLGLPTRELRVRHMPEETLRNLLWADDLQGVTTPELIHEAKRRNMDV